MNDTQWLTGLGRLGMRLGLENITELMERLGNPQNDYRKIHVAGSDGKGSTCAMLHAIISKRKITGLYTSPHIERMNERIVINGIQISDDDIERVAGIVRAHAEAMAAEGKECTFFEVFTAMAFQYFSEKGVEYAVIETGLGGRFDATNVIVPDMSIITHISLEHTDMLGNTVEKIAFEKAGIIKPSIPSITANTSPVIEVIRDIARERWSELTEIRQDSISNISITPTSTVMVYRNSSYTIGIPGRHQAENAAIAMETVNRLGLKIPPEDVKEALRKVHLNGRMETLGDIIVDVTHTSEGAERLAKDVQELYGNVIIVLGLLNDKDADGIARNLSPVADRIIVTVPNAERTMPLEKLSGIIREHHDNVTVAGNVGEAIQKALEEHKGKMILVTGSFHMAEDALIWLRT